MDVASFGSPSWFYIGSNGQEQGPFSPEIKLECVKNDIEEKCIKLDTREKCIKYKPEDNLIKKEIQTESFKHTIKEEDISSKIEKEDHNSFKNLLTETEKIVGNLLKRNNQEYGSQSTKKRKHGQSSNIELDPDSSSRPATSVEAIDWDDVDSRLLKLQNDTGYEIIQVHGQRIYGGPPPGWQGDMPGNGTEVYCHKIPRDCFEDELVPVFSQIGKIFELRLMIEFSGYNRGYFYVRYTNVEHAQEAIRRLDGFEIRTGQHLSVAKSMDNRRLWIYGIPRNRTAEEFKDELGAITSGISDVILYPSKHEPNKTRPYMFVDYQSNRAASQARKKLLTPTKKVCLFGVQISQVDWAQPENQVDENEMKLVKNLYVRHLKMSTSEETLWNYFHQLSGGQVERVRKPKEFAFIHFASRESAELVMKKCSDFPPQIDGQKVEVLWAKPPQKMSRQVTYTDQSESPQNWSPVQALEAVCKANSWGQPIYNLNCIQDPASGQDLYHYRITIPGYGTCRSRVVFQGQTWNKSDIGAKTEAAQQALSQLKLGQDSHSPVSH